MIQVVKAPLVGADLHFDPEAHIYRLPDGTVVPSVTQVLKAVAVSTDFDALKASSGRMDAAIERKRAIGTAVHADAHAFDDNDLDLATVHADVMPYLQAWITFRENLRLVPVQRERRLYSAVLGVCGTLDAVCHRGDDVNRRVLVDIKTGDPDDAGARYQTAAYQLLWDTENQLLPIAERWSVELTPGCAIPYRVHPYTDWMDGAAFRAFLTTYFCQQARRSAQG